MHTRILSFILLFSMCLSGFLFVPTPSALAAPSAAAPPPPILISPKGEMVTSQPQFVWKVSSGATQYKLTVYLKSTGAIIFSYTVPASRCAAGICRYTAPRSLTGGTYTFRVKAGTSTTWSYSSAALEFRIRIGGKITCPIFPANNIWNHRVDKLPVDKNSAKYIAAIGSNATLHPDFGSGLWEGRKIGIPYNLVLSNQPRYTVKFYYPSESDPGPYPIPATPLVEGGTATNCDGDCHILIVNQEICKLFELYDAHRTTTGKWEGGSGAIWNLRSNALRPLGWTSADAAGLPILAGLVRYDEVAAGRITHAIRFTAPRTQKKYVWPATHYASSSTDPNLPPMGQRFRLKASFNISSFSPQVKIILTAFKEYGIILADNGSPWYIGGAPDSHWNNDVLVSELRRLKGSDFEAVNVSGLMISPTSGEARP